MTNSVGTSTVKRRGSLGTVKRRDSLGTVKRRGFLGTLGRRGFLGTLGSGALGVLTVGTTTILGVQPAMAAPGDGCCSLYYSHSLSCPFNCSN